MQTLISAPPRTGKSLYCMSLIDKLSKKYPNRRIYTNIIGMNYPGVLNINTTPDKPFDWRDLPDGSIVFYDEAHEHPAFSSKDLLPPARTDAEKKRKEQILDIGYSLTLHGHFGFDIYLITQNPKLLNEHVRASCSVHYVMRRLWGLDVAMIYEFAEVQTYFANATRKQALSVKRFRYPKNLYKYYVSSNVHNIQKRVPMLYMLFFSIPILIFALGYSKASETGFFGLFKKNESKQHTEQPEYEVISVSDTTKTEQELLLQSKENFNPDIECRKGSNVELPQCVQWFNNLTEKRLSIKDEPTTGQYIIYNANKPYELDYNQFQYQATDIPQFIGCVKWDGKYYAYTQQGTRLKVPQADCKKYMNGDRPFNPMKQTTQGNYNASYNNQGYSAIPSEQNSSQISIDDYAKFQEYQRLKQEYQRSQPQQQNEIAHGFG